MSPDPCTLRLDLATADYVYNVIVLHMVAIDSDIDMAIENNWSSSYHVRISLATHSQ